MKIYSIESVIRFRNAFEDNCKKLSGHPDWGATFEETKKYFIQFVESKTNVLNTLPIDFYADLYNESLKSVNEMKL